MLNVKNLSVKYGSIEAIKGIDFQINQKEIVALIGANGAGKTTTLHTISGLLKAENGIITLKKQDISKVKACDIVKLGMSHVPEGRRVFANQTVLENLELGAYTRKDSKEEIKKDLETVFKRFPRLKERQKQLAGTLSGGEQQMLAMGRALMARPEILLLDEPSMGLAPLLVKEIFSIIQDINQTGTTILLVEQNAKMALSIADRAYVLENGKIIMEGSGKELANREDVKKAYLGG